MAKSLPEPRLTELSPGLTLLRPLTHRGEGPGLIVLSCENTSDVLAIDDGVPSLSMKWAEEGYTVVEIRREAWLDGQNPMVIALGQLLQCDQCSPKDQVGLAGMICLQI
jgi:carboxymethylenebutenolidase